jgi:hypothetical protein
MKNLLVLAILIIGLSSCKKQPIYPTDQLPAHIPTGVDSVNVVGGWGEFLITDAVMYVDYPNHDGQSVVYNHFGGGKTRSSLRYGGVSLFDIETIIQDTTTYSFWKPINYPGSGKFVLNDDTTKYYQVQYTGSYRSIIEDPTHGQINMGGSSRPFSGQTLSLANETVTIQIEETTGIDNSGRAIHYWTQLTLKKIKSW